MYKTPNTKVTGFFSPVAKAVKKVGKKVVGVTSDVMSAPAKMKAGMSKMQADRDVDTMKRARAYDNAPDEANDGDAGRTRFMAQEVKDRLKKKK